MLLLACKSECCLLLFYRQECLIPYNSLQRNDNFIDKKNVMKH